MKNLSVWFYGVEDIEKFLHIVENLENPVQLIDCNGTKVNGKSLLQIFRLDMRFGCRVICKETDYEKIKKYIELYHINYEEKESDEDDESEREKRLKKEQKREEIWKRYENGEKITFEEYLYVIRQYSPEQDSQLIYEACHKAYCEHYEMLKDLKERKKQNERTCGKNQGK